MSLDSLEWLWLVLAVAGLLLSGYGVADALMDLQALLVLDTDGDRTRVVRTAILTESLRLLTFVVAGAVAIAAIRTPDIEQAYDLAIIYSVGFILICSALVAKTLLMYQLRRFIVRFAGGRRPQEMSRSRTGKQDARDAVTVQGNDMSESEGRIGHSVSRDPEAPRSQAESAPTTAPTLPEADIKQEDKHAKP